MSSTRLGYLTHSVLGFLILFLSGCLTLVIWYLLSVSDLCSFEGSCTYRWLTPVLWTAILLAGVLSLVSSIGLIGYTHFRGRGANGGTAGTAAGQAQKHDHILRNVGLAVILIFSLTLGAGSVLSPILYPGYGIGSGATAIVSVSVVKCTNDDGVCSLQLTNTGDVSISAIGCYVLVSGTNETGVLSPNPVVLRPDMSSVATCASLSGLGNGVANTAAGSVVLSNGGSAPWSGIWQ